MKAQIRPLKGKYYGTIVDLGKEGAIEVWIMGDFTPSRRQLDSWGVTLERADADDYMCDNHYETALGFQIASAITKCLNRLPERFSTPMVNSGTITEKSMP